MLDRKERQWVTEKDAVATAETISAPKTKREMSNAIVPLMDTESAMLSVLNIGAVDGRKTTNGMVMGMRDELIKLLITAKDLCTLNRQADFLIASGWTKVVRCRNCKNWRAPWLVDQTYGVCLLGKKTITEPNHFCSYGERRSDANTD